MLRHLALFCTLFSAALVAQTGMPATPAGQALRAWMDAYNSEDRARLEAFVRKFEPTISAEALVAFHHANGPIEFVGIEKADNQHIVFQAKQPGSDHRVIGELAVRGDDTVQIQQFNFLGLKQLSSVNQSKR
jgi:hypothetical protein